MLQTMVYFSLRHEFLKSYEFGRKPWHEGFESKLSINDHPKFVRINRTIYINKPAFRPSSKTKFDGLKKKFERKFGVLMAKHYEVRTSLERLMVKRSNILAG